MATSLVRLAEAVKKTARQPRLRKAALELSESAVGRLRHLLDARGKVSSGATNAQY